MISNNGFDCAEMYGADCSPELTAVRMGIANYECRVCGKLTFGACPDAGASTDEGVTYEQV